MEPPASLAAATSSAAASTRPPPSCKGESGGAAERGARTGARAAGGGAGTVGYLDRHLGSIAVPGSLLGIMESDSRHLCGACMDSVPCGWSAVGDACDSRLISRRESGRAVPGWPRRGHGLLG